MSESYRSAITQVTEDVFRTLALGDVEPVETPPPAHPDWTASIFYAGEWKGVLSLACSEAQARAWAAQIMGVAEPNLHDALDGLGEVANVLAGNLKPLLPPGVGISTPSVVNGTDYDVHLRAGDWIEPVDFADCHGPFRVTFSLAQNGLPPESSTS